MGQRFRLSSPSALVPPGLKLTDDEMVRQVIDAMTEHLGGHFTPLGVSQGVAFELILPNPRLSTPEAATSFDFPIPASSTLH